MNTDPSLNLFMAPDAQAEQESDEGPAQSVPPAFGQQAGHSWAAYHERLQPYLSADASIRGTALPEAEIERYSAGMRANAHYFDNAQWMDIWLKYVHRYPQWRERWQAVVGSLDDKVLVDIGCGPGNVLASLGGQPREAIGVDIAPGSLEMAAQLGYVPLLADAHSLPLKSGIADIVAINGSLHHCDDMRRVLAEAARIVRPGGLLITDHDPQQTAWAFRGIALLMWRVRVPIYRWIKRGGHCAENDEQTWALATELHHRPGDGTSEALLRSSLEPLGFSVNIYPHNHFVGKEVFDGVRGRPPLKIRLAQRLSLIDPASRAAAMSLFCVARRPA
jgi:ubiquinone/menaquinone biosynthesis C-methylase UbiE